MVHQNGFAGADYQCVARIASGLSPRPFALVPARWPWGEGPLPKRPGRKVKARWGKWDAMKYRRRGAKTPSRHSPLMPAALMIGHHFSISAF
jgi:hypothetical protein